MPVPRRGTLLQRLEAGGTFCVANRTPGQDARSKQEAETLAELGIALMQGYLFARPMPARSQSGMRKTRWSASRGSCESGAT